MLFDYLKKMEMKKTIFSLVSLIFAQIASAQIANTSWSGTFNIPDPAQMVLQFKSDTLLLSFSNNNVLESMTYKINSDTLFIVKIDGQSPCDYTTPAIYKLTMKEERLFITALKDDCSERVSAWPQDGLNRID